MTEKQEQLLTELLQKSATMQANKEEQARQISALGEKIDALSYDMRTLFDSKFDGITRTLSNFGERIGKAERKVDGLETKCAAHSAHRDKRIDDLEEKWKAHDATISQLLKSEHVRRGKFIVIVAACTFLATFASGVLLALVRELISK